MDNRDWEILVHLHQHKSITKSAQNLFMTQPALTKRLQQIEAEFGIPIAIRGVKGITFTQEGEYMVRFARDMLAQTSRIKDEVSKLHRKVAGTLRLGVCNFFCKHLLPGLLKQFHERYPDVEFQVTAGHSKEIYRSCCMRDIHVGIFRGDYGWREYKSPLFQENLFVASSSPFRLSDLPSMPRIDFETDPGFRMLVNQWWSERFMVPPKVSMFVGRGDICKEMVLHGLGYGILPQFFCKDAPQLHTELLRAPNGNPLTRDTSMYFYNDAMEIRVVQAFVHFMEEQRPAIL